MRTRPRYTVEFRNDAVALLEQTDRSLPEVARELGVSIFSLRNWYNAARMAKKKGKKPLVKAKSVALVQSAQPDEETAEEQVERLQRELKAAQKKINELEMDRAILKKAAVYSTGRCNTNSPGSWMKVAQDAETEERIVGERAGGALEAVAKRPVAK